MQRLKEWCRHSLTVFFGYVQVVVGFIISIIPIIADVLLHPDVKAQILAWTPDKWDGVALMAIGVITVLARFRTL